MKDVWSGLADFLARMIEKYGGDLGLDDIPPPEGVKKPWTKAEVLKLYSKLLSRK